MRNVITIMFVGHAGSKWKAEICPLFSSESEEKRVGKNMWKKIQKLAEKTERVLNTGK